MAKNKVFKETIRQIHLWMGLGTGLVVFIISVTGCLYVFEKEIRDLTQKEYRYVPVQQKEFAGISNIITSFNTVAKKDKITSIRITNSEPNATVVVASKKKLYYFNPYTAELVKKTAADWLDTAEHIHTSLLLGEPGKFIIRWSVVIFVLILISGLVLWFPHQMRLLKQSLTIKWGASFKRVNYDLHNVLGFYASGILLVISLSGLYFAFDEVKAGASFLMGSKLTKPISVSPAANQLPVEPNVALRYHELYQHQLMEYPGVSSSVLAIRKDGNLRLKLIYPSDWIKKQNVFYFDPANGRLSKYKLFENFTAADGLESTNYDLHTGQLFGMFGKIVAFMAALISASLPVTGLIIWWKKQKKAKKKPVRPAVKAYKAEAIPA